MPIVSRRHYWAMVFAARGKSRLGISRKVGRRFLKHSPGAARKYGRKRRRGRHRARRGRRR